MNKRITKRMKTITLVVVLACASFAMHAAELVGAGQYYPTLKSAFDDINNGTLTGNVVLEITSSTTETAFCTLNASGTGFTSYVAVKIYPTGSGYTINGSIFLAGANNVTIDGRLNQTGSTPDLTIASTGSAIGMANASYNKIMFCKLQGMGTVMNMSSDGVIVNGCSNNMIRNNEISFTTKSSSNTALVNSNSAFKNKFDTLMNNKLFNFVTATTGTNKLVAINLLDKNYGWVIDGNSIYDAGFTILNINSTIKADIYGINIVQSTVANGNVPFQIKNNYIGGSAPECGGANLLLKHNNPNVFNGAFRFLGIQVAGNSTDTMYIDNNIIKGVSIYDYNTADPFYGIYMGEGIAIIKNNIIGSTTATGSLVLNSTGTAGSRGRGIQSASSLYTLIDGNSVGGVNIIPGNNVSHGFWGIHASGKITDVRNNLVGSNSLANNINSIGSIGVNTYATGIVSDATPATMYIKGNTVKNIALPVAGGIYSTTTISGQTRVIDSNTVSNLNSTTNHVAGIFSTSSASTISVTPYIGRNIITNLSALFNVDGIKITSQNAQSTGSITYNKVTGLSSTDTSATTARTVIGINNGNLVSLRNNFVSNVSTASTNALSVVYGIYGGGNNIVNNVISIGTTSKKAYGIFAGFGYMYHNTIYVAGANANAESACLWTGNLYCKNNIFVNEKQNVSGTTVRHLCIKQDVANMWSNDYNNYYAKYQSNGGGVARIGAVDYIDFPSYQSANGAQNVDSDEQDPMFINKTANYPSGFYPTNVIIGTVSNWGLPTIPNDYFETVRSSIPWMGALESQAPLPLTWKSFKAELNDYNTTDLIWSTSSEKNTLIFEVEKSTDAKTWIVINQQNAAGNSETERTYKAIDNEVAFGTTYYRIKQIDMDNKYTYSSVQKVMRINHSDVSIYPNPVMTTLNISLNNAVENTLIEIYSLEGRKIMSEKSNNLNHTINVEALAKGTYMIRISNSEKTYTSKFVRQ